MALVFIPQYTLTFDTNTGSDITYEMDILRSYDDVNAIPSWVSDAPRAVLGTNHTPIKIKVQDDRNTYKPIRGSEATINLTARTQAELEDLSLIRAGGRYEYQVRVRNTTTSTPVWCGFITPIGGGENISTFPTSISLKATDGLGLLEQSTVRAPEDTDNVVIFNEILESIRQTGLDLPVYVDSQIRHSGSEALTTVTAHPFSAYSNEDRTELVTRKEHLEGFLATFNCRIVQSNMRWYIYNASSIADTTTWERFEVVSGATAYTSTYRFNTRSIGLHS